MPEFETRESPKQIVFEQKFVLQKYFDFRGNKT